METNMKGKVTVLILYAMLLALSLPAEAQQAGKVPRLGLLVASTPSATSDRVEAFRQGLREIGYIEGQSIVIEYRYAEGKLDRFSAMVAELIRLKVDVIVTNGPSATRRANYDSHCHDQ